jgi:hypothetical protein
MDVHARRNPSTHTLDPRLRDSSQKPSSQVHSQRDTLPYPYHSGHFFGDQKSCAGRGTLAPGRHPRAKSASLCLCGRPRTHVQIVGKALFHDQRLKKSNDKLEAEKMYLQMNNPPLPLFDLASIPFKA